MRVQRALSLCTLSAIGVIAAMPADARPSLEVSLASLGFERIADTQGVTVYKDPSSDIIRVAAESHFRAPPATVRAALLAYEQQIGRIARLSECRVLEKKPSSMIVYQRLNLPVIDDRDFTVRVDWGEENGIFWVDYRVDPNRGPPARGGVVRVSHHEGSWQLRPMSGGKSTYVRYVMAIDLAGMIPRWLAKSGAGGEVPKVFAAMGRLVAEVRAREVRAEAMGAK